MQAWNWAVSQCTKPEDAPKAQVDVKMKDICPECVDGQCPLPSKADRAAAKAEGEDEASVRQRKPSGSADPTAAATDQ